MTVERSAQSFTPGHPAPHRIKLRLRGVVLASLPSLLAVAGCSVQGSTPADSTSSRSLRLEEDPGAVTPENEITYALTPPNSSLPREGSMLTVAWSAPAEHSEQDWIALYRAGAEEDAAFLTSAVVGNAEATSGHVDLALPPGDAGPFEARYLLESSYTRMASATIETLPLVEGEFALAVNGPLPRRGALTTIDWTAPADHAENDWIAVYRAGVDASHDAEYLAFGAVGGAGETSGQVALQLPEQEDGPFELRYLLASTYTRAVSAPLEIRPLADGEFAVEVENLPRQGDEVTVNWTAPADHGEGDWIALYLPTPGVRPNASSYVAFDVVGHAGETNGQTTLRLPDGESGPFEVRYMLASTYTRAADTSLVAPFGSAAVPGAGTARPQNQVFPPLAAAGEAANDGIVELQLSYEAFFRLLEGQAHAFLHEQGALRDLMTSKSQGAFVYRDTVLRNLRIGAPTYLSGVPADRQMLLEADIDVVASSAASPPGSALQHLPGKAWLMLTPDDKGLSYLFADGYLELGGTRVPLVEPGQPALWGRVEYPALDSAIGAVIFGKSMAHQTSGDSGVVAFRFSTRRIDDLNVWHGDKITAARARGNANAEGLLVLPGTLFANRTASALAHAIQNADDGRENVTDGSCCRETGWRFNGPAGVAHSEGNFHVHWTKVFSFSANVDLAGDVAMNPWVTRPEIGGDLAIDSRATISWTTNAPGFVDGYIDDALKEAIESQPGMQRESASAHSVTFVGKQSFPAPSALPNAYFSGAYSTAEGILAPISFRPPDPQWEDVAASWKLCAATPQDAQIFVSDASYPKAPLPVLLHPVVVNPPRPVDVRYGWSNRLEITLAARQLNDGPVTVTVATNLGEHTVTFKRPAAPDPSLKARACSPPAPEPLARLRDCWQCSATTNPLDAVVLPATPAIRQVTIPPVVRTIVR